MSSPHCDEEWCADKFSYFVVGELAGTDAEVIRMAGLLRGTESAVQAVSVRLTRTPSYIYYYANKFSKYGLSSVPIFAQVGGVYLNFGLWAVALLPGWLVVREIGVSLGDKKLERESQASRDHQADPDAKVGNSTGLEA